MLVGSCALFVVGFCAQPNSLSSSQFDAIVRNPLQPRDHSRRVDRLDLIDTATAFESGQADEVAVINHQPPCVVLAQPADPQRFFPRRGTWTSGEKIADFPFTELVPSWNVAAPKDTGIFFHVRVRDLKSQVWSPWLFVGRWGRTVHARPDGSDRLPQDLVVRFEHGAVRVDMPLLILNQPADAYQVRATLQSFDLDTSVNPSIRRIAIAYSGIAAESALGAERGTSADLSGIAAQDLRVPHISQRDAPAAVSESICLPSCVAMLTAYWRTERPLLEAAMAIYDPDRGMFANGARAISFAGEVGLDGWMQRIRNWNEAKALLGRGQPIIAAIHLETGEHVIVIRGFTAEGKVIVNDPLERGDGGSARDLDELGRAWLDCGGFALIVRQSAVPK